MTGSHTPADTLPGPSGDLLDGDSEAILPDDPGVAQTRPLRYERTWELELLISGAVAFALLQLPGRVDGAFTRLAAQLGGGLYQAAIFGYIYFKIILYALIATFIIHLSARAFWVGLVGLSTVFPQGVRWDNSQVGPISRRFMEARIPPLQVQSAAVDRFCSILFSFASVIVLTFVSSTVMVVIVSAVSLLAAPPLGVSPRLIFYLILVLVVLPILVAQQVDLRWGDRLGPRGRKLVLAGVRLMWWAQLGSVVSGISSTLFTNVNRRKAVLVFYLAFAGLLAYFIVSDVMIRMEGAGPDGYHYLPDETGVLSVAPRYYDDARGQRLVELRSPSIQSDIVRDPYLRLFLPYQPRRHNDLVAERCPDSARPLAGEAREHRAAVEAREAELLACIAALQPITLNGEQVREIRFLHHKRPNTGVEGLVAYLPTATLPRGENLLVVESVPVPSTRSGRDEPDPPHYIRFWVGD